MNKELVTDDEDVADDDWLRAAATNQVFEFLTDPDEDIYSSEDGYPLRRG